jgi:hypothetical protein
MGRRPKAAVRLPKQATGCSGGKRSALLASWISTDPSSASVTAYGPSALQGTFTGTRASCGAPASSTLAWNPRQCKQYFSVIRRLVEDSMFCRGSEAFAFSIGEGRSSGISLESIAILVAARKPNRTPKNSFGLSFRKAAGGKESPMTFVPRATFLLRLGMTTVANVSRQPTDASLPLIPYSISNI